VTNEFDERLHRDIEELVRSRMGSLEQDISRLQREVNQAFTTLLEQTDAAASVPESDQTLARISAEIQGRVGQANAESARLGSDLALLRDSVDDLGSKSTQSDVLNSLVDRLAGFAPRLVLFVVKGASALGWAARGFDEGPGNGSVRGLAVSLQSDTILRLALNTQQTFYGSPDQQSENQIILGRLGRTVPARVLAVPLKVRGKSAAVLYADSSDRGQESINVEAIELLVSTTGLVVELTSLRSRMGESGPKPAAPAASPAPPQPQAAAPEPAVVERRASAPLGAAPVARPDGPAESRQPSPTFFRPVGDPHVAAEAQVTTSPSGQFDAPWVKTEAPKPPERPAVVDEEEKLHNDARRFARLLVSEIKLYNEQKVAEGRNNKDLYDRLKEDIDRSRQMYDKRVSPNVAARFDYFYDELVNTLAEGDANKLGSDYPGPTVRV